MSIPIEVPNKSNRPSKGLCLLKQEPFTIVRTRKDQSLSRCDHPKHPYFTRGLSTATPPKKSGVSLAEVILALGVFAIGVLALIAYLVTTHRAAKESKHQAIATMFARTLLEKTRDSADRFKQATAAGGYTEDFQEQLLKDESGTAPDDDEQTRIGKLTFTGHIIATPTASTLPSDGIYSLVVKVQWQEQGRNREAILESRTLKPDF